MRRLEEQEMFEIEILEWMKNNNFLGNLIFGGGTMLRLCYDLNRFSLDLDFWTYRIHDEKSFYEKINSSIARSYEVTDSAFKLQTILFEIRKANIPGKLKIEIRKNENQWDFQEKIAFSKYSNKQILVKVFTLEQMMKNKIAALLERKEIRDAFDLEFIAKKGIALIADVRDLQMIKQIISKFSLQNYKVALGSLLEQEQRKFYAENNFSYLLSKI